MRAGTLLGGIAALALAGGPARAAPALPAAETPERALECLATAIVHEAGREPTAGQAAVARVVLNRVAHPAYPKTVCGVVYQGSTRRTGCQFTFTCDGSLRRTLPEAMWAAARAVAALALAGEGGGEIGAATHYHATYVSPYWAPSLSEVATIGLHRFYRFRGTAAPSTPLPAATTGGGITVWGLTVAAAQ